MAEAYVDKVANELADLALADQAASGDVGIVDAIGEVLGASSQSLGEIYNTAIRVRRAEARARDILARRLANGYKDAPKPAPAPLQGVKPEDTVEDEDQVTDENGQSDDADVPEKVEEAAPSAMPRRVTR